MIPELPLEARDVFDARNVRWAWNDSTQNHLFSY